MSPRKGEGKKLDCHNPGRESRAGEERHVIMDGEAAAPECIRGLAEDEKAEAEAIGKEEGKRRGKDLVGLKLEVGIIIDEAESSANVRGGTEEPSEGGEKPANEEGAESGACGEPDEAEMGEGIANGGGAERGRGNGTAGGTK